MSDDFDKLRCNKCGRDESPPFAPDDKCPLCGDGRLVELRDSARPEPTGDELARVEAAITRLFVACAYQVISPTPADIARAAIAALPPSGALGLATYVLGYLEVSLKEDPRAFEQLTLEKARALVAMLERREA